MVGLVVASHGRLAEELVATAEQIVGPLAGVATCSIEPGSSPDAIREKVLAAVESVDEGEGVIVLADLFGGTPCKESLMLCQCRALEVLAGVNLPMLIKASSLRRESMPLPQMAEALAHHAQRNITCASALLRHAAERRPIS
jgi:PTS system mannose-specific IIA component